MATSAVRWQPPAATSRVSWQQIRSLPLDDYEAGRRPIAELEGWIDVAGQFQFEGKDEHWAKPDATLALARLLRLLVSKCDFDANRSFTEKERLSQRVTVLTEQLGLSERSTEAAQQAKKETADSVRHLEQLCESFKADKAKMRDECRRLERDVADRTADMEQLKTDLEGARREARRASRELDEMRRALDSREADRGTAEKSNAQLLAEHNHLMQRYRSATKELGELKANAQSAERKHSAAAVSFESEILQLRQHVESLQIANVELTEGRDKAEAVLERREAEALRDLTEMQQLQRDQLEEEHKKYINLRDQYVQIKSEMDVVQRTEARVSEAEIRAKDETIDRLQKENDSLRNGAPIAGPAGDVGRSTGVSVATVENNVLSKLLADRSRLEQEVDALQSEVRGLEVRLDSQDGENLRLARALRDYERGDEGMRALRAELDDANRAVSLLSEEQHQLRERLAGMEDLAELCDALKQLCLRVGVTEDELGRLSSRGAARHSEVDTLRAEVRALKEEVEWVERERKHWMRKVRLQPLLDTKLRFELGLTQDQLRQLDHITEQMKSGGVVIDDGDYREKYYDEVRQRQREANVFNEQMRMRIEAVLASFVAGGGPAPDDLQLLRDRVAETAAIAEGGAEMTQRAQSAGEQARSLQRRVAQQELSRHDDHTVMTELRDRLTRVEAERDILREERDAYRGVVLGGYVTGEREGIESDPPSPTDVSSVDALSAAPTAAAALDGVHADGSVQEPPPPQDAESPPPIAGAQENASRLRGLLDDIRRRGRGRASAADATRVTAVLQQQLKAKGGIIAELERRLLEVQAAQKDADTKAAEATRRADDATTRHRLVTEEAAAASQVADRLEVKVQELERIRADLEAACQRSLPAATHELVQKVVMLRQREGRLVQRLRDTMQERDRLTERLATTDTNVVALLTDIRGYLSSEGAGASDAPAALRTVLPNRSSQMRLEDDILGEIEGSLARLARGELLAEDRRFVLEVRRLFGDMHQQQRLAEEAAAAGALRRQLAEREGDGAAAGQPTATASSAAGVTERRLAAKGDEIRALEEALGDATNQVAVLQAQLVAEGPQAAEGGGPAPSTSPQLTQPRGASVNVARLERELARYKSMNLALLQTAIDDQCAKKVLRVQLEARDREVQLLTEGGQSKPVSEFIAAALRDSVHLNQQCEMAQHVAKKLKLQAVVSEANFRVVANEAAAYKMAAYRLYRSYVDSSVKIIEVVRRLQRTAEGTMSAREAARMHAKLSSCLTHLQDSEEAYTRAAADGATANQTCKLLEDEITLLRTKDPVASAQLVQRINTDARSKLRALERCRAELSEDTEHLRRKAQRSETYAQGLEREISTIEAGSHLFIMGDDFQSKLEQLHHTVFTKTDAPPIAVSVVPDAALSSLAGGGNDNNMVHTFRAALDRQAEATRQAAALQRELQEAQRQALLADGRIRALKEELALAEGRNATSANAVDGERVKAKQREQRLELAHRSQVEVMQRASDHTITSLKELVAGKERALQHLQQQLEAERQRFLEQQLGDSARLERLHEQLFRENNAMVERFRATLHRDEARAPNGGDQPSPAQSHAPAGLQDALQAQLASLTKETLALRAEVQGLRAQNATLEAAAADRVLATQRAVREAMLERQRLAHEQLLGAAPQGAAAHSAAQAPAPVLPPVETALYQLTQEQSAALDAHRQREAALQETAARQAAEVARLQSALAMAQAQFAKGPHEASPATLRALSVGVAASESVADLLQRVAVLEQQLRDANEEVLAARTKEHQAAVQWREQVETMRAEVAAQSASVDQAKALLRQNEELRADVAGVRAQHDKMVAATALLRQQLVQKSVDRDTQERQAAADAAVGQKLRTATEDAAANLTRLNARVSRMQEELQHRIVSEEGLLGKAKEAQRVALSQNEMLTAKDSTIRSLTAQVAALKAAAGTAPKQGTQRVMREQTTQTTVAVDAIERRLSAPVVAPPAPSPTQQGPSGVTTVASALIAVITSNKFAQTDAPSQTMPDGPPKPAEVVDRSTVAVQTDAPPAASGTRVGDAEKHPRPRSSARAATSASTAGKTLPSAPVSLPTDVERAVARLQREHGGELAKYRDMGRRLERQLDDAEAAHKRDREAWDRQQRQLVAQADDLRVKLQAAETTHRADMLRFLQERNREQLATREGAKSSQRPSAPPPPPPPAVPTSTDTDVPVRKTVGLLARAVQTSPPRERCSTDADVVTSQHVRAAAELAAATTDMRAHETNRRLRLELEEAGKRATAAERQRDKARVEVVELSRELQKLRQNTPQSALPARVPAVGAAGPLSGPPQPAALSPTGAAGAGPEVPAQFVSSPMDIRAHKREVLRLEDTIDNLRRELNVSKAIETRQLEHERDRLQSQLRELEGPSGRQPTAQAGDGALAEMLNTKLTELSEAEKRLLAQDGQLLDLRFERETLAMRCQRLDTHLRDVLLVDAAAANKENGSPRRGDAKAAGHHREVAALEAVIANMKDIVERVQSENHQLRSSAVQSSKYMEAVREVRVLKSREREVLEHMQELSARLAEAQSAVMPGGRVAEHQATLQRRLRLAQSTAEQYQAELHELRTRLGIASSPPPGSRPPMAPLSSSGSPTLLTTPAGENPPLRSVVRTLSMSPYAAEHHHLDPHHRH